MRLPVLFCAVLMSAALSRAGNAPQASFTPGLVSTAIASPQVSGIAIDGEGNIYVSDLYAGVVQKKEAGTDSVTTIAGAGYNYSEAPDGVPATASFLNSPGGLALDAAGNLYIADSSHNAIRKVDAATGTITRVAGRYTIGYSGDGGPATSAELNYPRDIAIDRAGNLYIADAMNHAIRRVDNATGVVTTVAGTGTAGYSGDGGPGVEAQLHTPFGVALDAAGNLYIADSENYRIRRLDAQAHTITTVAGTGEARSGGDGLPAIYAQLNVPQNIAVDAAGNIYLAEFLSGCIRQIDASSQKIHTVVGGNALAILADGTAATSGHLANIQALALDRERNLYIGTIGSGLRKVTAAAFPLRFYGTIGAAEPWVESVMLSNTGNRALEISRISLAGDNADDFEYDNGCGASVAPGASCSFLITFIPRVPGPRSAQLVIEDNAPDMRQTIDLSGTSTDPGPAAVDLGEAPVGANAPNQQTFSVEIDDNTGAVSIALRDGTEFSIVLSSCTLRNSKTYCTITVRFHPTNAGPRRDVVIIKDTSGKVAVQTNIYGIGRSGQLTVRPGAVSYPLFNLGTLYNDPNNLATDPAGNVYIANGYGNTVWKLDPITGKAAIVAGTDSPIGGYSGDGFYARNAVLNRPQGLAMDSAGNLFIADSGNNVVRKVDLRTGIISRFAGTGNVGYSGDGSLAVNATLNQPSFLTFDLVGNLFITDSMNNVVRRVDGRTGIITTVAGNRTAGYSGDGGPGAEAALKNPLGLATDIQGNLYIADNGNHVVRRVSAATGVISTIAGTGQAGAFRGGPPRSVNLQGPSSLMFDAAGALYIDGTLKLDPSGNTLANLFGQPVGWSPVFDSDGNVYSIASKAVMKIARAAPALSFVSTAVGSFKGQTLTFVNTGNADLHIQKIVTEGVNASDFQIDNRCLAAIAPGDNCPVSVVFAPRAGQSTAREASLVIYDDAPGSPRRSGLTGNAYTRQLPSTVGWTTYEFYAFVGKHSRAYIPIQNLGAAPLAITGIGFTGQGADFFRAFTDCGVTVPANATCWITVEFTPRRAGLVNATITVSHDAVAAPLTANLEATGRVLNLTATLSGTDTDGDGSDDLTVWRPENGVWYTQPGSNPENWTAVQWGVATDVPVTGDFDGDGKTDIAVWRPGNGVWYIMPSSHPQDWSAVQWGLSGDVPMPGDFDGDGKTDIAVWRRSTGTWYVRPSSNPQNWTAQQWGLSTDIPMSGDFDGDGKTDIAIWRPETGTWWVMPSSHPQVWITKQWGLDGDVPASGDFDGDGKTDFTVWRPSNGTWYVSLSSMVQATPLIIIQKQWGLPGDIPVVRDFNGDGLADMGIWRPSNGTWYAAQYLHMLPFTRQWGLTGDKPM